MSHKRAYFFDSPPTSSGSKFNTQNIPSRTIYAELFESVAFFDEGTDMATMFRQGLVMTQGDADVISERNSGVVNAGQQYVLTRWQAPGTGVNDNGTYKESDPVDAWTDGSPVSGSGIKIIGKAHSFGQGRRIGYQVEMDISSLNTLINPDMSQTEFAVYNPADGKHYKLTLGSNSAPSTAERYQHNQDTGASTWTINHNLGYYPNIQLTRNDAVPFGNEVIEGNIQHQSLDISIVSFNAVISGKAMCV